MTRKCDEKFWLLLQKKINFGSGRGHSVWACMLDVDVILETGQWQPFWRGDFWGKKQWEPADSYEY